MTLTIEQAKRIRNNFTAKRLPEYMWGSVERYLSHGISPGGFLTAVLCNDLVEAVSRADDCNVHKLGDWLIFLYNDVPSGCWGTADKFHAWMNRGGMNGDNS